MKCFSLLVTSVSLLAIAIAIAIAIAAIIISASKMILPCCFKSALIMPNNCADSALKLTNANFVTSHYPQVAAARIKSANG